MSPLNQSQLGIPVQPTGLRLVIKLEAMPLIDFPPHLVITGGGQGDTSCNNGFHGKTRDHRGFDVRNINGFVFAAGEV